MSLGTCGGVRGGLAAAVALAIGLHASAAGAQATPPGVVPLQLHAASEPLHVIVRQYIEPSPPGLWPAPGPRVPTMSWSCETPCALLVPTGEVEIRTAGTPSLRPLRRRVVVPPGGASAVLRPRTYTALGVAVGITVLGGAGVIAAAGLVFAVIPPISFGGPTTNPDAGTYLAAAAASGLIGAALVIAGGAVFAASASRVDGGLFVREAGASRARRRRVAAAVRGGGVVLPGLGVASVAVRF